MENHIACRKCSSARRALSCGPIEASAEPALSSDGASAPSAVADPINQSPGIRPGAGSQLLAQIESFCGAPERRTSSSIIDRWDGVSPRPAFGFGGRSGGAAGQDLLLPLHPAVLLCAAGWRASSVRVVFEILKDAIMMILSSLSSSDDLARARE